MPLRRAFTLVELMVVISVIAVMAGMSIPAIGLIKRKVADMRCGHNLQQIGTAILAFRETHDDRFPDTLRTPTYASGSNTPVRTSLIERKDELLAGMDKIFICPRDPGKGLHVQGDIDAADPFGRHEQWDDLKYLHEPGCSYLYEANGQVVTSQGAIDHFLIGLPKANHPVGPITWATAKSIQQRTGNFPTDPTATQPGGAPFPADRFPIVRCFHHYSWNRLTADRGMGVQEVKAVSWNGTLFHCSPFWEIDIDRRFDKDGRYGSK